MRAAAALTALFLMQAGAGPAQAPASRDQDQARAALQQLLQEGDAAARAGNPAKAFDAFERAVPQAEALADPPSLLKALHGLGWGQWATGRYAASLQTRRRALDLAIGQGDARLERKLLIGLGETCYSLGKYDDALAEYRRALDVERRAPDPADRVGILSNMGVVYRSLGRFDDAMDVLREALALARPLEKDRGALMQTLIFLGIISRARGEYDRALEYYGEALEVVRQLGNRRAESQILGNTGNVYLDLGRFDRASALYRESLAIAEAIGYTAQVGFAHQSLGNALSEVDRAKDALVHYEAALAAWRKIERRPQVTSTLQAIGWVKVHQFGDVEGGRRALDEALAIAREIKEAEAEARALIDLGSVALRQNDAAAALARADEALAIANERAGPNVQYLALAARGSALLQLGRTEAAIEALKASAGIVNDLRANVSSDQSKIAFLDTKQAVFQELVRALLSAGRAEEALEAAEAARARAFADLLNERNSRSGTAATERGELASSAAAEPLKPAEMHAIAARLNATVVEYFVTDRSLVAWVIAGDRVFSAETAVEGPRLAESVRLLLEELSAASSRGRGRSPRLRELHRLLIDPIARHLPASRDALVVIVPHGPLALTPFAALVDAGGSPLVNRHTIAFAPSLSVYRYTGESKNAARRAGALIVADPPPPDDSGLPRLAGASAEAQRVAKRLGAGRAEILMGNDATETAVKRAADGRAVLHFAAHGLISEQRPLASSLVLAKGPEDDGYLRADEIMSLHLSARLVVLSGCSTGRGRVTGDGVIGLARSFMYAGAASLVVSQWDVDDRATLELMDRFYAGLGRGLGPAAALAQAQRLMRRHQPNPAVWAAFTLIGEP